MSVYAVLDVIPDSVVSLDLFRLCDVIRFLKAYFMESFGKEDREDFVLFAELC